MVKEINVDSLAPRTINIEDNILSYGTDNFLVEFADISDPIDPLILSRFGQNVQSGDIEIQYPYAYLVGTNGFTILDITDPIQLYS